MQFKAGFVAGCKVIAGWGQSPGTGHRGVSTGHPERRPDHLVFGGWVDAPRVEVDMVFEEG